MTEEEFNRLSPEMQEAMRQQIMQAEMMRQNAEVGFGAMGNPYGQGGGGQGSAAPQGQRQQEDSMPNAGGGGGMEGLPPGVGDKIGKGLRAKFGGSALGAEGGASIAGLASGEAPVAAGSLYGGYGSAPITVGAAEGLGAGGAAGGGGGGSMLAAAGPWAALAAAVFANEHFAKEAGRRPDDLGEQIKDGITGKSFETDMEYYGDKVGGPIGKSIEFGGKIGNPEGMLRYGKKALMPWEWF